MIITKTSDVLKGTDVLEGTINWAGGEGGGGCEWIVLTPRSPWSAILFRKETDHTNFVLNVFLSIRPVLIS